MQQPLTFGQESAVQLPRTPTRRGAYPSLRIIRRVHHDAVMPVDGYDGPFHRPGSSIPEQDLLNGRESALVLEQTECDIQRGTRRCWVVSMILWRYSRRTHSFAELARLVDPCPLDHAELRRIAARAIEQDAWREEETINDTAQRLAALLDSELAQIPSGRRGLVLDRMIAELVGRTLAEDMSVVEIPRRPSRSARAGIGECVSA